MAPFYLPYLGVHGSDRNELVSWVITYLGHLQPTYIGVIIRLLSTMDILVGILAHFLRMVIPFVSGVIPLLII